MAPLSHIPFRVEFVFLLLALSLLHFLFMEQIFIQNYSERVAGMQREWDMGASLAGCGLWETREGWVFRKGVVRRDSCKVSGCEGWRMLKRLCGRKVTGLSHKSISENSRDRNEIAVGKKVSGGCSPKWRVGNYSWGCFSIKRVREDAEGLG